MIGRPNIYNNTPDFAVVPNAPQPVRNRQTVRLYFIGTKVLRNGRPPIVNIAGRIYQMPPVGEYIEVDELVAKELMHRMAWFERGNDTPIPGVTTSAEIAQAVKEAFAAGNTETLDVRALVAQHALKNMDESALVAELKARGYNVELLSAKAEDNAEGVESGAEDSPAPEAAPAPRSSNRRNNKPAESK